MWNPFSRRTDAVTDAMTGGATASLVADLRAESCNGAAVTRNRIAQVQRIGDSAVATLTVTELLDELEQTGATHFVLDIQNVQFMDSACLGCLVEALNKMARTGGRIALANTANSVQYLFRMTQLDRVFPICADVMAALAAVERKPVR